MNERGTPNVLSPRDTSIQSARRNGSTSDARFGRDGVILWCSTIIASISGIQSACAQADKVLARERDGRRNVVERVVRPDPKIVENCSDSDLFELDPIASSRDRETQVHHPIHVVAIGDEVVAPTPTHDGPEPRLTVGMLVRKDAASAGRPRIHATFRLLAVNRLTNSSAFSATSRQPASIVSACPRPGILTISVTPLLRFCFL